MSRLQKFFALFILNTALVCAPNFAQTEVIKNCVANMTLRQKIGQLCLMNFRFFSDLQQKDIPFADALKEGAPRGFYEVTKINPAIQKAISQYHIGAVILFAENFDEDGDPKKLIRDMNTAALNGNNFPLLFCTDQEGGNVNRIKDFIMPSAMAIRRCGNLENSFLAGEATGRLLLDYGIHCNFAPVCDVNSNPANPVIGIRSFGDSANFVAEYSNAMRAGLTNAGCIPCAKHFPGHGNTSTDSHLGLPKINSSYSKWKRNEALPFIKNIKNGIPMIMTAHIQMPKLDGTKIYSSKTKKRIVPPATLSNKILTDILREKLEFDGVIVSDAMDMQAITDNFTPSESFILAVNAGVNLVCHPINVYSERDLNFLEQFFEEVEDAAQNGKLDTAMLDQSVERVLLLKAQYGLIKIQGNAVVSAPQKITPMTEKEKQEAEFLSHKIHSIATHFTYKNRINVQQNILFVVPYWQKAEFIKDYFKEFKPRYNYQIYVYYNEKNVSAALLNKMKKADTLIIFSQLNGYGVKNSKIWSTALPAAFAKKAVELGKAKNTTGVSTYLPYDEKIFPKQKGFGFCATYDYSERGYNIALDEIL